MFNRINVPLDGSELAGEALVQAKELAHRLGSGLHLVRVVDAHVLQNIGATGLSFDYGAVTELVKEEDQDAIAFMDQQVAALKEEGLNVSGAVVHGPVASSIVASAEPDDLIVMASHGRTGIRRWFLGSVAEGVLREANAPVMLVRRSHADHPAPPVGTS